MSMAPRCPQCRVPLPSTRLCAVCQAGIVMRRVEYPTMSGILESSSPPRSSSPRPRAGRTNPTVAPSSRITPAARVEVPCGTPGCGILVSYHADGFRRLQANGHPPRCDACRQQQRKATTAQAWARYKVKHQHP